MEKLSAQKAKRRFQEQKMQTDRQSQKQKYCSSQKHAKINLSKLSKEQWRKHIYVYL